MARAPHRGGRACRSVRPARCAGDDDERAGAVPIVVAGGSAGRFSAVVAGWSFSRVSSLVMRRIR